MNKKIILITGGTGFIASNFIEELIDKNYSIIATTRKKNLKSSNKNLKYISCSFEKINTRIIYSAIIEIKGDISEKKDLREIILVKVRLLNSFSFNRYG